MAPYQVVSLVICRLSAEARLALDAELNALEGLHVGEVVPRHGQALLDHVRRQIDDRIISALVKVGVPFDDHADRVVGQQIDSIAAKL